MDKDISAVEAAFHDSEFQKREEQWSHIPYNQELILLDIVKNGQVEALQRVGPDFFPKHDGHLSSDPLRQRRYECVAAVTLVSRFAVEGGLDVETAYSLADSYIRLADIAKSAKDIQKLLSKMPLDFTQRVRAIKERAPYSKPIALCIEFIDSNMHYPITLTDLAEFVSRNAAYLSVLFKKELGLSVKEYITTKRLAEAKRLLKHTEMTISQIANTLAFNSQSYFTLLFRTYNSETPVQYRNRYFRMHNNGKES